MFDVSVSYNRYKFIGNEFITWLWFVIENNQKDLEKYIKDIESLYVGNRIALENDINGKIEKIIIKGDDAGLEEGITALKKGAFVTEINLLYKNNGLEWKFNLKGESLNISGLKIPETGAMEEDGDMEGVVLEKVFLFEKAFSLVDTLYENFIRLRISNNWVNTLNLIRNWIYI